MADPPPTASRAQAAADPGAGARQRRPRRRMRRRTDWGGRVARVLCGLFAIVGALPLAAGALARMDSIQSWAALETARILQQELALDAQYDLRLQPWPPRLVLTNLRVNASDGAGPFLHADEVTATPLIFSLLAGEMNLGEVHIEQPRVRVVIRDGQIANLKLKTTTTTEKKGGQKTPLRSISITNAQLSLDSGPVQLRSTAIDLDVNLEDGPVEIFLRAGESQMDTHRDGRHDEDVICRVELRARVLPDEQQLIVRRLHVEAVADFDPRSHTRPGCDLAEDDWRRLSLEVAGVNARAANGTLDHISGRARGRLPVPLVHRFAEIGPTTGSLTFDLNELRYNRGNDLPILRGHIGGTDLGLDGKYVARTLDANLSIDGERVRLSEAAIGWGGGLAQIEEAIVYPKRPGIPLTTKGIHIDNITIEDLLNDLGAMPHAHVSWLLDETVVPRFGGTLSPLNLAGPMSVRSRDLRIYDRAFDAPNKRLMMSVDEGRVFGQFTVTEDAVVLAGFEIVTPGGKSRLLTTVSLGFESLLGISISEGSRLDFSDVSPIAGNDMQGVVDMTVVGGGPFNQPQFNGSLAIDDFHFSGFPIGQVAASTFQFAPVQLLLENVQLNSGRSELALPRLDINFGDADATVVIAGRVDTRKSARCTTRCRLSLADFYHMVQLEKDPDFAHYEVANLSGVVDIGFVLGGRRDPCGGGRLRVRSQLGLDGISIYDELFDRGTTDFDFVWDDPNAGGRGMYVDVHSATLHKGPGTVMARASIRHGGRLQADLTSSSIPLGSLSAYQRAYGLRARHVGDVRPEANLAVVGSISGSLERISGRFDIDISPLRIGPTSLAPSRFRVDWLPSELPLESIGRTRCGNLIPPRAGTAPRAVRNAEGSLRPEDMLRLSGALFGSQVRFDDLRILRQSSDIMTGDVALNALDLGALANLVPGIAFSASPPEGNLTGKLRIGELNLDEPAQAELSFTLTEAEVARGGDVYHVGAVARPFRLSGEQLQVPKFVIDAKLKGGLNAKLTTSGTVSNLSGDPKLDIGADLTPVDLAKLVLNVSAVKRAAGELTGGLRIGGTMGRPELTGLLNLNDGSFTLQDMPVSASNVTVALEIKNNEVVVKHADATIGTTGSASIRGRASLDGIEVRSVALAVTAREVKLPLADGVKMTADAALQIDYAALADEKNKEEKALPNITGNVTLASFSYTRPMRFSVDLDQLTSKKRTLVDEYNPKDDIFTFDISLRSPRPLRIANNLIDMRMRVNQPGLRLAGTNQRYGARGGLSIERNSKLFLQGHRFDVRDGRIAFDNPSRIAPKLDVRAVTEYRRYGSNADIDTSTTTNEGSGGSAAGSWRITMHAYGDTDEPKLRFTSEPALQQDDIVLLLQIGMTRAELDRGLAGSLAQTVGLEALSAATGFDQAVRSTVPLVDEFRIGSQYSSRSGRPEPTLSVGKRLTDNVRATVTTGLAENGEVRSNIEWKLSRGISLEALYDNVNDVSSSTLGNVGADLRWRLEFD